MKPNEKRYTRRFLFLCNAACGGGAGSSLVRGLRHFSTDFWYQLHIAQEQARGVRFCLKQSRRGPLIN